MDDGSLEPVDDLLQWLHVDIIQDGEESWLMGHLILKHLEFELSPLQLTLPAYPGKSSGAMVSNINS